MSLWPAGKDSRGSRSYQNYRAGSTINYPQLTKRAAVTITQALKVTPAHTAGLNIPARWMIADQKEADESVWADLVTPAHDFENGREKDK